MESGYLINLTTIQSVSNNFLVYFFLKLVNIINNLNLKLSKLPVIQSWSNANVQWCVYVIHLLSLRPFSCLCTYRLGPTGRE